MKPKNPSDFWSPKIRRIFRIPKSDGFLATQKSVVFFGGWIPKISKFGTLRLGLGWGN